MGIPCSVSTATLLVVVSVSTIQFIPVSEVHFLNHANCFIKSTQKAANICSNKTKSIKKKIPFCPLIYVTNVCCHH